MILATCSKICFYVTPTVDVIEEIPDFLTESPNSAKSFRSIQGEWD